MYRYYCVTKEKRDPISVCGQSVPLEYGSLRLLRQQAFKGESLVPVIPTQFALLILPTTLTNDVAVSAFDSLMNRIVGSLSAEANGIQIESMFHDEQRSVTFAVLQAPNGDLILDLLSFLDSHNEPFLEGSMRRAIGVPCDARTEVGTALLDEYYELPACPLCCDRLERSISGFNGEVCVCKDNASCGCHAASQCVVCTMMLIDSAPATPCSMCSTTEAWICLVCGFVGCSRYRSQHAKQHYVEHRHTFSLSLTTQQVWDYEADNFVHRMLVMKVAGRHTSERLELPSHERDEFPGASKFGDVNKTLVDAKLDTKVEQTCIEYSRLLASQLESQRRYYESLIQNTHGDFSASSGSFGSLRQVKDAALAKRRARQGSMDDAFGSLEEETRNWKRSLASCVEAERQLSVGVETKAALAKEEQALLSTSTNRRDEMRTMLTTQEEAYKTLQQEVAELEETVQQVKLNLRAAAVIKSKADAGEIDKSVMFMEGGGNGRAGGKRGKRR